jgi:uncharacterized membrane protein
MHLAETLIAHILMAPLMCLITLIWKKNPPENVNNFYGYRTSLSMKSQENWDIANKYAPKVMLWICLVDTILQVVFFFMFEYRTSILVSAAVLVISLPLVLLFTERHLKNMLGTKSDS